MEVVDVSIDISRLYHFWICSLACSSFDRGSNWALRAFAKSCHDTHGRTPNSLAVLILALIHISAPLDIRVATTSQKSSSGTLLKQIQCNISVNHVVATGCLIPENFLGASKFLSVKGLAESPPPTIAVGTVPTGLVLLFSCYLQWHCQCSSPFSMNWFFQGWSSHPQHTWLGQGYLWTLSPELLALQGVLQDISLSFDVIDPQDLPERSSLLAH